MRVWMGFVAAAVALAFGGGAAWALEPAQHEPAPGEEAPHEGIPLDPILVQGYVKTVDEHRLVLTAPGAPEDLPLRLIEETRVIRGEQDAELADVKEGGLVRAALVPVGEEFVAVVVEVVPEEPAAPGTEAEPEAEEPAEPAEPDAPSQTL